MSKLKIVDGQFVRDGEIEPLEIGNKEQIAVLNSYNNQIESFNDSGLELDVDIETTYTACSNFKCICGQNIFLEAECDKDDEEYGIESLSDISKICTDCKKNYITSSKDGTLIVKFKK